jgi:putative sporulation protein YyaC
VESELNFCDENMISHFTSLIKTILDSAKPSKIAIVCLGSREVKYDSYGPLVGSMVEHIDYLYPDIKVFGTLTDPITALNLEEKFDIIKHQEGIFVIAIDAALTDRIENLGIVCVDKVPIRPGAWADKILPVIGDMSIKAAITAKVSSGGGTRQICISGELINGMAKVTAKAIERAIKDYKGSGINPGKKHGKEVAQIENCP